MASLSFAQVAYALRITTGREVKSGNTLAQALGLSLPLPVNASLTFLVKEANAQVRASSGGMSVTSISPPAETKPPRTAMSHAAGEYPDAPAELVPGGMQVGRVASLLQWTAQLRDGNAILDLVADNYVKNANGSNNPPLSYTMLTAMTQLAVTGSNAFAAWQANPSTDRTARLTAGGLSLAAAQTVAARITSDFNAAMAAVRNPRAGIDATSLRDSTKMSQPWIAVCAEFDPPDYPVNVSIARYPQFHQEVLVPGSASHSPMRLDIRFIVASSEGHDWTKPSIPPGSDVVLYIHGEGSRAEEASDFIDAMMPAAQAAGRPITVIAPDLPGSGYTTSMTWTQLSSPPQPQGTWAWVRETPQHLSLAPMPPITGKYIPKLVDTSDFAGAPILDFVEQAIVSFVEAVILPLGNRVTAVMGGSLGGHMALRLAAGPYDWVRNVAGWSPASVWEYDLHLLGVDAFPHHWVVNPQLAPKATDPEQRSLPSLPDPDSRRDFFDTVWVQPTFPPPWLDVGTIVLGLLAIGVFPNVLVIVGAAALTTAILALPGVPRQPDMWYSSNWQGKSTYIDEGERDRHECYNTGLRQWHWRICLETVGYKFDALRPNIHKPLLLMAGEDDDYPQVQICTNVKALADALIGPGLCVTVYDTGHSIHNERPEFLADQILSFTR